MFSEETLNVVRCNYDVKFGNISQDESQAAQWITDEVMEELGANKLGKITNLDIKAIDLFMASNMVSLVTDFDNLIKKLMK